MNVETTVANQLSISQSSGTEPKLRGHSARRSPTMEGHKNGREAERTITETESLGKGIHNSTSFSSRAHCIETEWPLPTEEAYKVAPLHMTLYYDVGRSGLPNYMSGGREIPSDLHCDVWQSMLADYHDSDLVDFLRFGWPVAYSAHQIPVPTLKNHASALRFPKEIDKFIKKGTR